jgi:hypothetical protein
MARGGIDQGLRMPDSTQSMTLSVLIEYVYLIIPFSQSSALSNEAIGTSRCDAELI